MKKYFNFLLTAALMGGLSLGYVSCSDDDDDDKKETDVVSNVTVEAGLLTHGIEVDMNSQSLDIAVTAEGMWTATLQKGTEWVAINEWQVTYDGSKKLTLRFDNNTTGYDRTTTLNLGNSDGEVKKITVRQKGPDVNASGQNFADKGVGCGIDYDYALNVKLNSQDSTKFEPTKVHMNNNIFNISQIEKLKTNGINGEKIQASAYVEAPIPFAELEAIMLDSSLVQSKEVDLSLKMGVSFGVIEFSARGHYCSTKQESRKYVDYTITRNAPMYNAYLSPAEITAYASRNSRLDNSYEDGQYEKIDQLIQYYQTQNKKRRKKNLNEDGLTPEQQEEIDNMYDAIPVNWDHAGVFSANFSKRYNELYNALVQVKQRNKPADTAAAEATMNAIDNEYGPFFISGGDFGGALIMHCRVDNMKLEGQDTFEGDLEADVAGMFNVSGEFKYSSDGFNMMHDSNAKFWVFGGNADETADALWALTLGDEPDDRTKWQAILKDWVASMYSNGDHNQPLQSMAAPLSFVITPIWSLFSEPEIQQFAQDYFMKKYETRGIKDYFGIMTDPDPNKAYGETMLTNIATSSRAKK